MIAILLATIINIQPAFDFLNTEPFFTVPVATDTGIAAVNRNPAGLTSKRSFLFSSTDWISDAGISTFQFNWNNFGLAINYYRFGRVEYQDRTPDDYTSVFFNPYAYEVKLGRSFRVDPELKVGIMVHYFRQTILNSSADGFYSSIGLLYTPAMIKNFSAGVSFENIGFKKGFINLLYRAPIQGNIGVSYTYKNFKFDWNFSKVLTYEGAFESLFKGDVRNFVQVSSSVKSICLGGGYEFGNDASPFVVWIALKKSVVKIAAGIRPGTQGFDNFKTINLQLEI